MYSIEKVNRICHQVRKLTDVDFQAVTAMVENQTGYAHPLKMGKAQRLHACGGYNQRVVTALHALWVAIKSKETSHVCRP